MKVLDNRCTANFVFRSPDNASLYVGTAAHCMDDLGVRRGDSVTIASGSAGGTLVYNSWATMRDAGQGFESENDFALVRIDDAYRASVHPAVLHFGGPTGLADHVDAGERVLMHGNTSYSDPAPGARSREGYVVERGEWHTAFYAAPPGVPGDSGAPVLSGDGRAIGSLSTTEVAPKAGANNAANLDAALTYMHTHTNITVELVTWPLLTEGRTPGQAAPAP